MIKFPALSLSFFATLILFLTTATALAQEPQPKLPRRRTPRYIVKPSGTSTAPVPRNMAQSLTAHTIPLWSYHIVSPLDGKSYSGYMVGRSPFFHGQRTTTVQAYLVPVILTFADTGSAFDPTTVDSCLGDSVDHVILQSPIFQNSTYIMNGADVGTTQYVDAFQRANFWSKVSPAGNSYHTRLQVRTAAALKVTVPAANGITNNLTFCGNDGELDINWWDNLVQTTILPSLASQGIGPTVLPIFVFDSVEMCDTGGCGILGYHNAYFNSAGIMQTYSVADFDNSGLYGGDVSVLSHEIGEWMDDPAVITTGNLTPAWGNTGQVSGCQTNLEVGDPLTGFDVAPVTLNGFTYTLQELAFFSWFFRQSPSLGAGGLFSNDGTFSTDAGLVCM
ncbi:MAG TPA: hypothetical protein VFJ47_16215 [Terriglobales bacterium]|nr:hypothetical protein [Terriglobales bacterium]